MGRRERGGGSEREIHREERVGRRKRGGGAIYIYIYIYIERERERERERGESGSEGETVLILGRRSMTQVALAAHTNLAFGVWGSGFGV